LSPPFRFAVWTAREALIADTQFVLIRMQFVGMAMLEAKTVPVEKKLTQASESSGSAEKNKPEPWEEGGADWNITIRPDGKLLWWWKEDGVINVRGW
jgi:hypothetical protein